MRVNKQKGSLKSFAVRVDEDLKTVLDKLGSERVREHLKLLKGENNAAADAKIFSKRKEALIEQANLIEIEYQRKHGIALDAAIVSVDMAEMELKDKRVAYAKEKIKTWSKSRRGLETMMNDWFKSPAWTEDSEMLQTNEIEMKTIMLKVRT